MTLSSSHTRSKQMAQIISALSTPMIFAALSFSILLLIINPVSISLILVVALLFGTFFPLLIIYSLYKLGKVKDMDVSDREKRNTPFLVVVLSYVIGTAILVGISAPPIVSALMFCYATNTLITSIVNLRWKISVHAIGVAGPFTCLTFYLGLMYSLFLLSIIPVGWARIKLKAHTSAQVIVGFILFIPITLIQIFLLINFVF